MPVFSFDSNSRGSGANQEGTSSHGLALPERLRCYGSPQPLGKGATSVVYKMLPPVRYVTKVIDCGRDQGRIGNALYELRVMRRLSDCPLALRLVDSEVVSDGGAWTVYIVEEYCTPLVETMRGRALTAGDCVNVAIGVTDALIACRDAGVLHLDVQPKNIYLSDGGEVRLGDFGSSLLVEDAGDRSRLRGTLAFMAPEVFRDRLYSERSDIYSVGILLYCLLNGGAYPFTDKSTATEAAYRVLAGERLPRISLLSEGQYTSVVATLSSVCAFDASERPQSFEAMRESLVALRESLMSSDAGDTSLGAGQVEASLHDNGEAWGGGWDTDTLWSGWGSMGQSSLVGESWQASAGVPFDADPIAASVVMSSFGNSMVASPDPVPVVTDGREASDGEVGQPVPLRLDKVRFSVVSPRSVERDEYATIDMFMYEQGFRDVVEQLKEESFTQVQEKQSGFLSVREDATVRVVLSSDAIQVEDGEQEQIWLGGFLSFSFDVFVPSGYRRNTIPFTASIYVNGIVATRLKFVMRCTGERGQRPEIVRHDIQSAFVSYASADRDRVVALIQGMRAARPDLEIFFDVQSLRAGEDWKHTIMREVESRDVLYLCWSRSARASKYVELEWRHALETKGIDYIEPVPIEPPTVCPPPEELRAKHFNDMLLYLLGGQVMTSWPDAEER